MVTILSIHSNYGSNAICNLVKDKSERIRPVEWNVYGKIQSAPKGNGSTIAYTYDTAGNRILVVV